MVDMRYIVFDFSTKRYGNVVIDQKIQISCNSLEEAKELLSKAESKDAYIFDAERGVHYYKEK